MTRYRARWVFPGDGPPIPGAVIQIRDRRFDHVTENPKSDAIDLGDVAIVPGLINVHTHLEFSSIQQPIQPLDQFSGWVRNVIDWRRSRTTQPRDSISSGLSESVQSGVTTLGEIATTDWRRDHLLKSEIAPRRVVMFREFLGLADERVDDQLSMARQFLDQTNSNGFIAALSPHAPYSVHPAMFSGLCDLAADRKVLLAMHLAESRDEMKLLQTGTGPMVDFLKSLGIFRPELFPGMQTPLDFLKRLDFERPVLVVHGNYLSGQEIDFLSQRPQISVVYCPRTHAEMQSGEHPWQKMLAAGVNVAIGTDSRASNPDLSIWNELRYLQHRHANIASNELLRLATWNAARALDLKQAGRIVPGNFADMCVVQLDKVSIADPEPYLFRGGSRPVAVMQAGQWTIPPPKLTRD